MAEEPALPPTTASPAIVANAEFAAAWQSHMEASGFRLIEDDAERQRLAEWFYAQGEWRWNQLRNVSYDLLEFKFAPPQGDRSAEPRPSLTVSKIDAVFEGAARRAGRYASMWRMVFLRDEGFPTRIGEAVGQVLCTFTVDDGRRRLEGQYPPMVMGRQVLQRNRPSYQLVDPGYHIVDDTDWSAGGFYTTPRSGDVLLTWLVSEPEAGDDDQRMLTDLRRAATNPFHVAERVFPGFHSRLALQLLNGDPAEGTVTFYEDDSTVVVARIGRAASRLSTMMVSYDRATGHPIEFGAMSMSASGALMPSLALYEYVEFASLEGEFLHLPSYTIDASPAVAPLHKGAIDLLEVEFDQSGPAKESSRFFFYRSANDPAWDNPARFDFDERVAAMGMRVAPTRGRLPDQHERWGPHTTVYGVEEWDEDLFAQWDEEHRDLMARARLPVGPEDVLPYAEILRRRSPAGTVVLEWYEVAEDGTVIPRRPDGAYLQAAP